MLLETLNKTHFNAKTKKNPYYCNISKEAQNYNHTNNSQKSTSLTNMLGVANYRAYNIQS
jgi:hypothetical protein